MDKMVLKVLDAIKAYRADPKNMKKAAKVSNALKALTPTQCADLDDWMTEPEALVLSLCCIGSMKKVAA